MQDFVAKAAGKKPADILITNAQIVNVFTGCITKGSLAIADGKILGTGLYEAKETIDAKGRYLMPGLIDAHVHIESSLVSPAQFAHAVMPHGTTTVVADPHEIANVKGLAGIRYMLEATEKLPLTVRIMLPPCVPATSFEHSGATLSATELEELIDHKNVGGIAEVMNFPGVVAGDTDMLKKIALGHTHGKIVDGHSPTLEGKALNAYVAAGVMTDHECTTLEEMQDRLSRGMYVLIREGSAARNLDALLKGITPATMRRCVFCTDDRQPEDIVTGGHINNHLRKAVSKGIDPVSAIIMATLNAAECYNLKGKGAIAPGYDADLCLVEDLQSFTMHSVFAKGKLVAKKGRIACNIAEHSTEAVVNSVNIHNMQPEELQLPLNTSRANVIKMLPHSIITEAVIRDVSAPEGIFDTVYNKNILKLAVIERHHATGHVGVCLIEGYGLTKGAVATTVAHDSHNIVVIGDNDADMLAAIADITEMGGGITMCRNGNVLEHLPLPIAGIMSDKPAEFVGKHLREMNTIAWKTLGINRDIDPFMTLSFMTLPVIPELKLTDSGLFDVRSFSFTPISID